jgi:hypothetical protein
MPHESSRPPSVDREWLARLRQVLPQGERGLVGYEAIARWFAQVGWLTRAGRPPAWSTVKWWYQTRGLPLSVYPFGRVWTTNYLLTAWCLSAEARRLALRNADGTFKRVLRRAPSRP